MIMLSVLLHALMLSIFLLTPSLPSKKWTFGPVYSVDLVDYNAVFSSSQNAPPAVAVAKELTTPQIKDRSTAIRKTDENRSISILKQPSLAKTDTTDNARREQAIEALKKRLAAAPDNAASGKTPAAVNSSTHAPSGDAATKANAYYARIWSRIKSQWALPRGILPQHRLEAVLNVAIQRDGTVSSVSFEKGSGNAYFDQSAVRAVRKASPLPPLPEWIRETQLEVGLRFRSTDFL